MLVLAGFFANLSSTISDYSAGGISWTHQVFYNVMHGRPLQSSLFASKKAGESVGFGFNPYPYIHTYVIHVSVTPYAFAPLWSLWPILHWLYGMVFLVNYIGMPVFGWLILRYLSPNSAARKTLLTVALLLGSGFLFTIQQKAQLLLFCGPLILAAYYFLLTRRRVPFVITVALLCMISEDAAMVVATFALYVWLFEPEARWYAYTAGGLSIVYLALVLLVIQPAARRELLLTEPMTAVLVIKKLKSIGVGQLHGMLDRFLPVLLFLPAFLLVPLLFGRPRVAAGQLAGLVLLAPLPHWGETFVVGAAHHLMPVVAFTFLAVVVALGRTPDAPAGRAGLSRGRATMLLAVAAAFVVGNLRVVGNDLPNHLRPPLYRLLGKREAAARLERSFAEESGNRRVIEVVEAIPGRQSLVFLTNSSVEGFIAGRSDIWKFPDYYDVADFLVLQRNAHQAFFWFPAPGNGDLGGALAAGRYDDHDAATVSEGMVRAVIRRLAVELKSHRVVVDDPSVVLLERIEKRTIPVPPTTVGLGWLRNVRRLWMKRS